MSAYATTGRRKDVAVTVVIVFAVATVAAYVSYRHAHQLVRTQGEDDVAAALYPLTVDGLIFAASMVIVRSNKADNNPPRMAWFALAVGIVATLAANLAHGIAAGPVGMVVAAWPAVALVLSFEMLMRLFRPAPVVVVAVDEPATHEEPAAFGPAQVDDDDDAACEEAVTDIRTGVRIVPDDNPTDDVRVKSVDHTRHPLYLKGRQIFDASVRGGNQLSQRRLAEKLGMRNTSLPAAIIRDHWEAAS